MKNEAAVARVFISVVLDLTRTPTEESSVQATLTAAVSDAEAHLRGLLELQQSLAEAFEQRRRIR